MSKFGSRLETGYVRVVDVVEDFVLEATKATECKRLPRSNIATGQYTGSSKFHRNLSKLPTCGKILLQMFQDANL